MPLPYENATSGKSAIGEMQKLLRTFGASSFGTMEDFAAGKVIVQFEWRDSPSLNQGFVQRICLSRR